jgi:hypothetical protein
MLEDHLYWVMVYWRWMHDGNFERGPANFFKRVPAIIRPLVKRKIRGKVRRSLYAHGISRHKEDEMTAMSDRAFDALSRMLGDNKIPHGQRNLRGRCHRIRIHRGCVLPDLRIAGAREGGVHCRISARTVIG